MCCPDRRRQAVFVTSDAALIVAKASGLIRLSAPQLYRGRKADMGHPVISGKNILIKDQETLYAVEHGVNKHPDAFN